MFEASSTDGGWTRRRFLAGTGAIVAGSHLFDPQLAAAAAGGPPRPADEDGYESWLRYRRVDRPDLLSRYRRALSHLVLPNKPGPVLDSAVAELVRGLSGLTGREIRQVPSPASTGAVILGTPASSSLIAEHIDATELEKLGPEGYVLRRQRALGNRGVCLAPLHARRRNGRADGGPGVRRRPGRALAAQRAGGALTCPVAVSQQGIVSPR